MPNCPKLRAFTRWEARPKPEYVALPKDGLKLEKDGTKYEFEPEVEFEFQNERGKYRDGKYAAVFNLQTKDNKTFWFCSLPVEITSSGPEAPKKKHDILTCSADQTTHRCPGIGGCLDPKNKIDSHAATMAGLASPVDSGLVLRPHKSSTIDSENHNQQGI